MAVRCDTPGERLYRTANLPSLAGPWTITLWYYKTASPAYGGIIIAYSGLSIPDYNTPSLIVGYTAGGTVAAIWVNNAAVATGPTLATSQWHSVWVVRGAATNRTDVYFNAAATPSIQSTNAVTGTIGNGLCVGGAGGEQNNGRWAAMKWWSAVLTYNEMVEESAYHLPQRTANLEGWYPLIDTALAANQTDYSGLGRSLSSNGTLTVEDGPPIAWMPRPSMRGKRPSALVLGKAPPPRRQAWRVLHRRTYAGI